MSSLSLGLLLPSLLLAALLRAPLAAHANYAGPAIVEVTLLSFRANGTYCIDRGSDSQAWDNGCDLQIEICPRRNTSQDGSCSYGGAQVSQTFRNTNSIFKHLVFKYFVNDFSKDSIYFALSAYDIQTNETDRVLITSSLVSFSGITARGWLNNPINGSVATTQGVFAYAVVVRQAAGSAVVTMTLVDGWSNSDCDKCCFNFKKCDLYAVICAQDYSSGALGNCLYRSQYKTGLEGDENYRRFSDVITFAIPVYAGGFAARWTLMDDDLGTSEGVASGYLTLPLHPSDGNPVKEMETGEGGMNARVSVQCILNQDDACVDRCYVDHYQNGSTCVPCTKCAPGSTRVGGCSGGSDTVCSRQSTCTDGSQYQVEGPTWYSDCVCAACSGPCDSDEYTLRPCHGNYDRECRSCRTCSAYEYETTPCTASSNRVCAPITQCDSLYQREVTPPTFNSDRVCANCTTRYCDTNPPLITLLGAPNVTIEYGCVYFDPGYQVVDEGNGSTVDVQGLPLDTNMLGLHIITYTATDRAGNSASVRRYVTVVDSTPPQCALMGPEVMTIEGGFPFSDPGINVFDLADRSPRVVVSPSQVNTFIIGQVAITYTVTDASGNVATRVRTLLIRDTLSPTITLIGNPTIFVDMNKPFTDPGARAFDLVERDVTSRIVVHGLEGGVSTAGPAGRTFSYTYSCSDTQGNEAVVVQRYVQIVDNSPPRFVLNGSEVNILIILGSPFNVNIIVLDSSDRDISKNVTVLIFYFASITSPGVQVNNVDTNKPGRYQLAYTATDPLGQSSTLIREVNVVPPVDNASNSSSSSSTSMTLIIVASVLGGLLLVILLALILLWRRR